MADSFNAPDGVAARRAWTWSPMAVADLDGVMAVASDVHASFPERREVFAERLALFPAGCHVLKDAGGRVGGYAVSHPWDTVRPVPLDTLLVTLPATANRYIHDVAILPALRGGGFAGEVVGRVVRDACRDACSSLTLVAVSGSQPFWERQGFRAESDPDLSGKLKSYGGDARLMTRSLTR
jgi:hypothetical protein